MPHQPAESWCNVASDLDQNTLPGEGRFRTKIAWGLVDQSASSVTNFGLSVLGGRLLGPSGLGVIAIGFSAFLIFLVFERALLAEPAVIVSSSENRAGCKRISGAVVSAVLLMGVLGALALALVGILVGGHVGRGLLLVSPWLIPALLQDLWRMLLFRDGRGLAAACNDGIWFLAMLLLLPIAWKIRTDWGIMGWWGLGATFAALLGFVQVRTRPVSLKRSWAWLSGEAWALGRWFAAEGAVYTAAAQFVIFLVAGLLGTQAVGGLRSVQVLFAPLALLGPATALPALPVIVRALRQSAHAAWRMAFTVSVVLFTVALAYLVGSLVGGQRLLSFVYGQRFTPYASLIWALGTQQVAAAAGGGFFLLLKAGRRGKAMVLYRSIVSLATVTCVSILGTWFGLRGAAWGMALGTVVGTISLIVLSWPDKEWRSALLLAHGRVAGPPHAGG